MTPKPLENVHLIFIQSGDKILHGIYFGKSSKLFLGKLCKLKVRMKAKIRNRYNQAPNLNEVDAD